MLVLYDVSAPFLHLPRKSILVDCSSRTLPYISERGANNSGPNAERFRESETGVTDRVHSVPYAKTNIETVNTISTELRM